MDGSLSQKKLPTYIFGIYRNGIGEEAVFLFRKKSKPTDELLRVLETALAVNEYTGRPEEAQKQMNALAAAHNCKSRAIVCHSDVAPEPISVPQRTSIVLPYVPPATDLQPGDVIVHSDGEGHHLGVYLGQVETKGCVLFCTSSNEWNPKARKVTRDELILLGKPDGAISRGTYFAPVMRPLRDLFRKGYSFPEHRVIDLMKEFFPSLKCSPRANSNLLAPIPFEIKFVKFDKPPEHKIIPKPESSFVQGDIVFYGRKNGVKRLSIFLDKFKHANPNETGAEKAYIATCVNTSKELDDPRWRKLTQAELEWLHLIDSDITEDTIICPAVKKTSFLTGTGYSFVREEASKLFVEFFPEIVDKLSKENNQ